MPIDLEISVGDIIKLPTGLYRFCSERPNNVLLMQREGTALDLPLPEWKLKEMLGNGTAEKVDFVKALDDEKKGPNDNASFGPGEDFEEDDDGSVTLTPEYLRAKALQFYTKKHDEFGGPKMGAVGLQKLIDDWRPIAIQKCLEPKQGEPGFRVKPARLKYAIQNCGKLGERPLRLFRSRRGKTGRKRFAPFVETELNEAVAFYWRERQRTYDDAYASFRSMVKSANEIQRKHGREEFKFPTRPEVLRRRIDKAMSYVTWSQKYSKHEAHQKFRGIMKHLNAEAPLDLVIMDHTQIDSWVVLDSETYLPLGRPYLTVAIDVCTRMVLGYLITFEHPSIYSVMTCLKRVNKNKNYVKTVFPEIQHKWDGWGRPRQLLVDHGWEFTSPSLQDAMHDLGTDLIWAPVKTPQYKAIGERFFRTLNMKLFHRVKGAVPYDPKRMRLAKLEPRKEAMITLSDLDELMHELIIDGYHRDPHKGLNNDSPARLWREKLMFHKRPWIRDIKSLNALLGRTATATLDTGGITFNNLQFHERSVVNDLLRDLVKFEAKRSQSPYVHGSGRVKVKIKWNPIDASSIEVWNHASGEYVTLENRDKAFITHQDKEGRFVKRLSFWHAEQIRQFAEEEQLDFRTDEERWEAKNLLRKKWEKLAGTLPMRKSRDPRRGLTQSMGTYDDTDRNEDAAISPEDVVHGEARPSPDGMEEATLAPDIMAGTERRDHQAPQGRRPSKKTKDKIKRTKERKRQESAVAEQSEPKAQRSAEAKNREKPRAEPVRDNLKSNNGKYWDEN